MSVGQIHRASPFITMRLHVVCSSDVWNNYITILTKMSWLSQGESKISKFMRANVFIGSGTTHGIQTENSP